MGKNMLDMILTDSLLQNSGTAKQKQILEASIRLFAEKGYANTSTYEIAKEAGVSEGTLFRYYKTKEILLKSILGVCKNNLVPSASTEFMGILKMQSFVNYRDFLKFAIKNRLAFIQENRQIFKVFIKESLYSDAYRNECFSQLNEDFLSFANGILNAAKARGEVKDMPNRILIRILFNIASGYLLSRLIIFPEEMFLDDDAEADILFDLIMSGIGERHSQAT